MATSVWKQLASPDLSPSTITLCDWDNHPSQPLALYRNFPITVVGKTILINIKVIDAPLDDNILLGHTPMPCQLSHSLSFTRCLFLIVER